MITTALLSSFVARSFGLPALWHSLRALERQIYHERTRPSS